MKRLTKRQRLMAGGLVLAAGVWAVDALTGGGPPTAAQASPAAATTAAPVVAPRWRDVSAVVGRMTGGAYRPVADEIEQLDRDLFLPSAALEAVLVPAVAEGDEGGSPAAAAAQAAFQERHRLVGVMLGHRPLAVIDDNVLTIQMELDGYRLVAIERESVTFQKNGAAERITLTLEQGPKKP